MLSIIALNGEEKYISDFIELPKRLYDKKTITQNEKEELAIINGAHVLSGKFRVFPFVLYDGKNTVGRFIITLYPDDEAAYIGYFECFDSAEYAKTIFDYAKRFTAKHGRQKLIGPYDASFWIKYRLKTNNFGAPYIGEPYNKPYYPEMFFGNGFTVLKRYITNHYPKMPQSGCFRDKFFERYNTFINNGYTFKSPDSKCIDEMMAQCYEIITELYSDFPGYKPIEKDEFTRLFSHLKLIADKDMMKMAYFDGRPAGFLMAFPDYSNSLYKAKLNLHDYASVIINRKRAEKYIWLYMGVMPEHRGLGKALANALMDEQFKKKSSFAMALIKDDNVNSTYMKEIINVTDEYILMECVDL